jgi:uncharacterized protein (DUF983 family)
MTFTAFRVLCANCGGDELLSRLVAGRTACPWCGLGFSDESVPGGSRPVLLSVVLVEEEAAASPTERWEELAP